MPKNKWGEESEPMSLRTNTLSNADAGKKKLKTHKAFVKSCLYKWAQGLQSSTVEKVVRLNQLSL